jgi:hypothetical protein
MHFIAMDFMGFGMMRVAGMGIKPFFAVES